MSISQLCFVSVKYASLSHLLTRPVLVGAAAFGTVFDRMRLLYGERAGLWKSSQGLMVIESVRQQILHDLDAFLGRFAFDAFYLKLTATLLGCKLESQLRYVVDSSWKRWVSFKLFWLMWVTNNKIRVPKCVLDLFSDYNSLHLDLLRFLCLR